MKGNTVGGARARNCGNGGGGEGGDYGSSLVRIHVSPFAILHSFSYIIAFSFSIYEILYNRMELMPRKGV